MPRACLAEVEAVARASTESLIVGDPFDPATVLGPLLSASLAARPRKADAPLTRIQREQETER